MQVETMSISVFIVMLLLSLNDAESSLIRDSGFYSSDINNGIDIHFCTASSLQGNLPMWLQIICPMLQSRLAQCYIYQVFPTDRSISASCQDMVATLKTSRNFDWKEIPLIISLFIVGIFKKAFKFCGKGEIEGDTWYPTALNIWFFSSVIKLQSWTLLQLHISFATPNNA